MDSIKNLDILTSLISGSGALIFCDKKDLDGINKAIGEMEMACTAKFNFTPPGNESLAMKVGAFNVTMNGKSLMFIDMMKLNEFAELVVAENKKSS